MSDQSSLSARERQIMEVIYSRGEATATNVLETLPNPPSRSAVRTFLRILEEKGHLKHITRGREYVYRPKRPRRREGQAAVRRVVEIFFRGSLEEALAVHLADPKTEITNEELARLEELIRQARDQGK